VTKRRELERQDAALEEIMGIMGAMKNLALLETHKLARYLATQRRVVESLEAAAEDFLSFHPEFLETPGYRGTVFVLIGSERGFCGDYNGAVRRALEARLKPDEAGEVILLPVGYRLASRLGDDPRVATRLDGAGIVEEIEPVLLNLVRTLGKLQRERGPLRPVVFHHRAGRADVQVTALDPFSRPIVATSRHAVAPQLYLAPNALMVGMLDQYLYASLFELFYSALMAENELRIQHMEGAIRRLEQECRRLELQSNALRQEEITEEIEVIMLSAETMAVAGPAKV